LQQLQQQGLSMTVIHLLQQGLVVVVAATPVPPGLMVQASGVPPLNAVLQVLLKVQNWGLYCYLVTPAVPLELLLQRLWQLQVLQYQAVQV
jgi:hypothetical protein